METPKLPEYYTSLLHYLEPSPSNETDKKMWAARRVAAAASVIVFRQNLVKAFFHVLAALLTLYIYVCVVLGQTYLIDKYFP
jgi:hypothetical protein